MLTVHSIPNALFFPAGTAGDQDFICDENGSPIADSCVIRGPQHGCDAFENVTRPDHAGIAALSERARYVDETFVFLGLLQWSHFGHVITESISRFWALDELSAHRIIASRKPFGIKPALRGWRRDGAQYWRRALGAFDLKASRFALHSEPIRAREILVPQRSASLRSEFHPEHFATTRRIGRAFHPNLGQRPDNRPVYLSRTRLRQPITHFSGEMDLERLLVDRYDVLVIHPQEMTPRQTITLFNRHDTFVGLIGSAFHNLLFRLNDRPVRAVYLCMEHGIRQHNYRAIDAVVGVEGHYVECCRRADKPKHWCFDLDYAHDKLVDALTGSVPVSPMANSA